MLSENKSPCSRNSTLYAKSTDLRLPNVAHFPLVCNQTRVGVPTLTAPDSVDLLMARLHELGEGGQPVEVVRLYNFTSFDIMADLCFGRPMELLSRNDYSPWLTHVLEMLRAVPFFTMILYYPLTRFLFTRFQPGFVLEQRKKMWQHTVDRVNRRLEENPDRPDIWNLVLKNQGSEKALSVGEMHSNAEVFMIAGSETIGTNSLRYGHMIVANLCRF